MKAALYAALLVAGSLQFAGLAHGQPAAGEPRPRPETAYVQSWLGAVDTDQNWQLDGEPTGDSFIGDLGTLPYVGGAGSRMWGDRFRYGFEGGGLVAWESDVVEFSGTGNGLRVVLDNQLYSFEVFMGGMLSAELLPGFRLSVSGGPTLAWARLKNEDEQAEVLPSALNGNIIVIDLNSHEDDFSAALYARAGVEYELDNGFTFGVSARYVEHTFDFGSSGKLKLDEVQWFLTLGATL